MEKLTIFEFIVRAVPESFVMIFSVLFLCNIKSNFKKYVLSAILLSMFQYIVRLLPINYGVHTILGIFFIIILMNQLFRIEMIQAIKYSLIVTLLLFGCELINLLLLNIIFGKELESIILNIVYKTLLGIPSLIGLMIIIYCWRLRKKNVDNK